MNIGKLYKVKRCFYLILPTKETTLKAFLVGEGLVLEACAIIPTQAADLGAYFSKVYNSRVTYFSPDSYIVFLEEDGRIKNVLTSDGKIGWIAYPEDEPWVRQNKYIVEVKP